MDQLLILAQANGDLQVPAIFGGGCLLVWLVLVVLALGVWLWALIDAIQNPGLSSNERLIWILVIVFTSWIGALIYLLIGRKRKIA